MNKTAPAPVKPVAPKPIPFGPEDKTEEVKKNSAPQAQPIPEFVVERDAGIPPRIRAFKGESKYPISGLNVGDRIRGSEKVVRGASVAARSFRKKEPNRKFSIYKLATGDYALVRTA
jgi:hypothetical protein